MFKFNVLKKPQNRRFNYTPRYFHGKEKTNVYSLENRIEAGREQINTNDYGGNWKEDRKSARSYSNRGINKVILLLILALAAYALYILDFDLSIFMS